VRAGWVRLVALAKFSERKIGFANTGDRFVCTEADARRLIAAGLAAQHDPLSNRELIARRAAREEAPPRKKPEEEQPRPPEATPEQSDHGPRRPWPFSGADQASRRVRSKPPKGSDES